MLETFQSVCRQPNFGAVNFLTGMGGFLQVSPRISWHNIHGSLYMVDLSPKLSWHTRHYCTATLVWEQVWEKWISTHEFRPGQTNQPKSPTMQIFESLSLVTMNVIFRWKRLRLFGLDYHGATLDIIASHQVFIWAFCHQFIWLFSVHRQIHRWPSLHGMSAHLLMQGTLVKLRKVKKVLTLIQVFYWSYHHEHWKYFNNQYVLNALFVKI